MKTETFKRESKIFPTKIMEFLYFSLSIKLLASNGRREYLFVIKSMQIIVTLFMNPTFFAQAKG